MQPCFWSDVSCCRFAEKKQRSPLEGVPFAVIDAIDVLPYPTTAGTSYVRPKPSARPFDQS